jgi:hypothetical protein
MSRIILSCGDEVDDFDHTYNVMIKSTDREGNKAISYKVVCGPCEDMYRQRGEIFDHENAMNAWLQSERW